MRISTGNFFTGQIDNLTDQYEKISRYNTQIVTGYKLQRSSEDPVLAYRIKLTGDYISNLDAFKQNGISARNRNEMFQTASTQAISLVDNVQQVLLTAANDTQSDAARKALGGQISEYLKSLLGIANTKDGTGQYIYAGYNSNTPPYTKSNDSYIYNGGFESTSVNIGPSNQVVFSESGYDVFSKIMQGNGTFVVSANSANTGTAWTDAGNVFDSSAYVADNYTISFAVNGSGETVYSVTGAVSGQVVPPLPATIPNDAPVVSNNISFNGISLELNEVPQPGDSFTVAPAQYENVFETVQRIVNLLDEGVQGDPVKQAQFHQVLNESMSSLNQIRDHLIAHQSVVGTRIQTIDNQVKENTQITNEQNSIKSQLESADPVEVYTQLLQQQMALQAAQTSYGIVRTLMMDLLQM